jgi:ribonuclease VapC
MFLDASAVVAIMTQEQGADALIAKIVTSRRPIRYSSVTVFEAVIAISRKAAITQYGDQRSTPSHFITRAQADVEDFLRSIRAVEMEMSSGLHNAALDAAKTYGRFVGHRARLNFGDCFAYAAAKTLEEPLLFVGTDFSQTDIDFA